MITCVNLPLLLAALALPWPIDAGNIGASMPQQQEQECSASSLDPSRCLATDDVGDLLQVINTNSSVTVDAQPAASSAACEADTNDKCSLWASMGDCYKNPQYMNKQCRTSCNSCEYFSLDSESMDGIDNDECVDEDDNCESWAEVGECRADHQAYMFDNCRRSCKLCPNKIYSVKAYRRGVDLGVPQLVDNLGVQVSSFQAATLLKEAREYMLGEAPKTIQPAVLDQCRNQHEMCTFWAALGECDSNPSYMKRNCAPVCKSCDFDTVEGRCPIDPDAPKAWAPGDLDKLFQRLTSEPLKSQYNVEILSSPAMNDGPWVVSLDNVISEAEAEKLIHLGQNLGYERSTTIGSVHADGSYDRNVYKGRTSSNTWCQGACYEDKDAQAVMQRMSNITGIPETNSEYLQLLQYKPGQFYEAHTDYSDIHSNKQCGVRILTMYVYLADVEEGGGTNFDKLGLTVQPKRGRAAIWPSVMNDDPTKVDSRTTHAALPVIKGTKYGANAWFHLNDYKTPRANGCE